MKKILISVLVILVMSLSVVAAGITISAPKSGEFIKQGDTYFIKWKIPNNAGANVKINIFRNSISSANFVEQILSSNNGSAKWVVSKKFIAGKYVLRIKSAIRDSIFNDSSIFNITVPSNPPPSNNNLPKINPNAANTLHPKYMKNNTLVINPIVVKFKPERDTINSGESVKLFYHYKDTVKAHIYNRTVFKGDELLTGKYPECNSFIIVTPKKTSRYELNVSSNFKTITRDCKVIVKGISPPPPPPKTKSLPVAEYFKAIPDLVEFGKGTTLKFKVTNATSIIIKDHDFKIIFSWSGKVTDVVEKTIPAKLRCEKNKFFMTASNKTGDFYGYAWVRWKSVIRDFSVKSVNRQKIVFHYDYSLAEKAKIKHLNTSTRKWETVMVLKCFNLSCEDNREITYKPGEYKLILLGYEGVFESDIVKVN